MGQTCIQLKGGCGAPRGRAQQRRQAAVLAERHLQVELAALLPGAVVAHDVRVLRQCRDRLDLVQAPARARRRRAEPAAVRPQRP